MSSPQERDRPRQPGKIRSVLLALAVHGAFFALIFFGVSWQSRPSAPLQAELWDRLPVGRPAVTPPAPAPKSEPPPEPKPAPEPKPEPEPKPAPKPAPEPPKAETPRPDPAIAEKKAREKKERERLEREKREQARKEQARQKELERKREQERKEREAKAKAEAEAKAAAQAKAAAEARARAVAEAKAKAEAEAAAQALQSEIDLFRGRIRDKIRGRANVPDSVRGRPEVQVRITILPGGDVLDIVVLKSSGNRVYDEAIVRAIRSAQPLPVPPSPELFAQFRSLTLNIQHER